MFFDLALSLSDDGPEHARKVEMADKLGYDCVVSNQEITRNMLVTEQTSGQEAGASKLALEEALKSGTFLQKAGKKKAQPLVLTRATYCARGTQFESILFPNGPLRRQFDILAIQPLSTHTLAEACLRLDVDLIYFDLSKPLPCKLIVRDLTIAIKRGIHFEIDYNPALRGAGEGRTVFFAASQMVCKALKGRNIVISSRARNAFELRGPHDIINFAALLGLQESDAKAAISSRCQKVLKHALEAKAGKDAYSSRPHQGENEGHDDKRQKLNSEEESMPATLEAM